MNTTNVKIKTKKNYTQLSFTLRTDNDQILEDYIININYVSVIPNDPKLQNFINTEIKKTMQKWQSIDILTFIRAEQKKITTQKWQEIRKEREQKINSIIWQVERHKQEIELQRKTTLNEKKYICLLQYIQKLRDIPTDHMNPNNVTWPIYE